MYNRVIRILLTLFLLSLSACVSLSDKNQYISNTSVTTTELDTCQPAAVLQDNTHREEDDKGLDPENISLLNWNIYKGNGEDWQKDLSAFAKDHQILTIQEALIGDDLDSLLAEHDFNWVMNTAFYMDGDAAGVMNVASTNAVHSCGFKVPEPLIRIPKSTLISYYRIEGSEEQLLVANIHGINFTFGVEYYSEQLYQLFDAVKYHDGPMIVAGDFNSWSDSRMEVLDQVVDRLSLSRLEYPVNKKTHLFGKAIDHVFYRDLQLVSNQVWQVSSSDHNPISVTFKLKPESRFIAVREIPEACASSC